MSDIFISYARSTAPQAQAVAQALRALGYGVWLDDEIPAHRSFAEVIEERLKAAKAVVVIWSAEAAKSEWVQSEADRARADRKLVQLSLDGAKLPMPFDRIQCADMNGWKGDLQSPGWRKVLASIGDLVGADTESIQAPPPPLPLPLKPSIAVLPFTNLSGDPEQDYFADGMVEEITNALSRVKSIFVIASGSGLSFKGKAASPQEAAQRLGVRYVLEGSVRKAASRVRISVQLIDGTDGAQIWTHRFEDTLEDVFALQDRVALGVVGAIEPTIEVAEIRRASGRPTENMGSYDLYLRSLALLRTYVKADVIETFNLLNRAIALDPENGPALRVAASVCYVIDAYGWSADPESNRSTGVDLAHRALKSAPDDASVLAGAALVMASLDGDFETAVTLVERAIALNPGSALPWLCSGLIRVRHGEADLAADHLETAIRLDPLGPNRPAYTSVLGIARFYQGRFDDAVALEKEVVQLNEAALSHAILAASWGHLGRATEAKRALAAFRIRTQVPIEAFARNYSRDAAHQKLFLDGIALAEGRGPP